MGTSLAIERLYAQRRRLVLRLREIEKRAEAHRAAIAATETELRGLVLFVAPFRDRQPNPHFRPGELARLCRDVLRERPGRRLYAGQIAVTIMQAKGLPVSDHALCRAVCRQTQDTLRRMQARGSVAKVGTQASARWSLAVE